MEGNAKLSETMLAYEWMNHTSISAHLSSKLRIPCVGKFSPLHPGDMETHLRDLAPKQARLPDIAVIISNSAAVNENAIEGVGAERASAITPETDVNEDTLLSL
jgi:hypothetical protein